MELHTIIKYKNAVDTQSNQPIRIYQDDTEKSFVDIDNAMAYKAYLESKLEAGETTDYYTKELHEKDELDIYELTRVRALSLLSEEDKRVLNLK
jgi:hypothetical protein